METNKKNIRNIFLGVAGCIVLYWILNQPERITSWFNAIGAMLSPFVVGAVIAFILNVPMRAIERALKNIKNEKGRRVLAMVLTVLIVLLVVVGIIYLLVPQLIKTVESLVSQLPGFYERVKISAQNFLARNPQILAWLGDNFGGEGLGWGTILSEALTWLSGSLGTILDGTIATVLGLGAGIFNAVLSLVFSLYCLARKETLARQGRRLLYAFFPEKFSDEAVRILRMTNSSFSNFISGQCLEAVILGGMFAVCMAIFRMPYTPLISAIIAVTALVPIVGAFAGCAVGAFFILVVNPMQALWFVVMFLVLQQIEGNMIYPRVVGTSIGLPGMWVLVAVSVGGDLMGVGGMLLMIPVAAVLYALLREITDKRLAKRNVDGSKLVPQPPELKSKFKEKSQKRKEKRKQNQKNTEETKE